MKQFCVRIVAIVAMITLVILVRVGIASHQEFAQGNNLVARSAIDAAVTHFRRAARWYFPGNPYSTRALQRLEQLAIQAEAQGQTERALETHRAIRAAIMSTRSLYTPHADYLERANRRIASLMAQQPPSPIDAAKSIAVREQEHLALLTAPVGPRPFWSVVTIFGFGLWVYAGFMFFSKALDASFRLQRRPALQWSSIFTVGFALFILGMALA